MTISPGRRRIKWSFKGNRLAKSVFFPNVLTGKGAGFFVRMPDGVLIALPATQEKLKTMSIRQEVRLLALKIRLRERRKMIRQRRKSYFERLRQRRAARRAASGGERDLSEFFSDMSLRPGDVVTTNQGLQVFKGTADFPYTASHFTPLARWRKGKAGKRTTRRLDALQRQLRRGQ